MKQMSSPSFSSPEEKAMQNKLLIKFNLNQFPFENIEEDLHEGETSIYKQFGQVEDKSKLQEYEDEDEMFNVFPPFVENETFQTSGQRGSPGPILSLMSQAKYSKTSD